MSTFHPQKLSVNLIFPVNFTNPVIGRKYTLTHSDQTGELYLDIGYVFNLEAIDTTMRDEVLAEWRTDCFSRDYLLGAVYVDAGEFSIDVSQRRFNIFKKELPLALTALVYGDRQFIANYPWLLDAPIYIEFHSSFPQFNQKLSFGTSRLYLEQLLYQ
jgi:hypothetical protein